MARLVTTASGRTYRILESADDVTDAILDDAESCLDFFNDDRRVDWERFFDRLADTYGAGADPAYDLESYDNPATRK